MSFVPWPGGDTVQPVTPWRIIDLSEPNELSRLYMLFGAPIPEEGLPQLDPTTQSVLLITDTSWIIPTESAKKNRIHGYGCGRNGRVLIDAGFGSVLPDGLNLTGRRCRRSAFAAIHHNPIGLGNHLNCRPHLLG